MEKAFEHFENIKCTTTVPVHPLATREMRAMIREHSSRAIRHPVPSPAIDAAHVNHPSSYTASVYREGDPIRQERQDEEEEGRIKYSKLSLLGCKPANPLDA